MVGQWSSMNMQLVARSLLIYRISDSGTVLGLAALANAVPTIIFSLWGGAIADRMQKKSILLYSLLASALGTSRDSVNSRHHQAVSAPGAGLRVCARSADGVIEAIESPAGSFRLGVPWHPERLRGAAGQGPFAALLAACHPDRAR